MVSHRRPQFDSRFGVPILPARQGKKKSDQSARFSLAARVLDRSEARSAGDRRFPERADETAARRRPFWAGERAETVGDKGRPGAGRRKAAHEILEQPIRADTESGLGNGPLFRNAWTRPTGNC